MKMYENSINEVFLYEIQRQSTNSTSLPPEGSFSSTTRAHQMYIYEYNSVTDLISKAENGIKGGYIDLQVVKVNFKEKTRTARFYPYVSNTATTTNVNNPLQRIKVIEMEVDEGDTLFLYVTLNSRNGARIVFGGIEIE